MNGEALSRLRAALRLTVQARRELETADAAVMACAETLEATRPPDPGRRLIDDTRVFADRDKDGFMASYFSWRMEEKLVVIASVAGPGEGVPSPEGELVHQAYRRQREAAMQVMALQEGVVEALVYVEVCMTRELEEEQP